MLQKLLVLVHGSHSYHKLLDDACCGVAMLAIVNKQLNDKERVAAALDNSNLLEVSVRCFIVDVSFSSRT